VHEFHIQEAGGFLPKTLKELGSQQAAGLVTAGCAAFGVDCSGAAQAGRIAATALSAQYTSSGENYYITGRLTKPHAGNEWWGLFDQLRGYQVCNVNNMGMKVSPGSTFNTSIFRSGPYLGLGFYAVVPQNSTQPEFIDAIFSIDYVPIGTAGQYGCAADGSHPWLLRGPVP
jgi:hypothetical protein